MHVIAKAQIAEEKRLRAAQEHMTKTREADLIKEDEWLSKYESIVRDTFHDNSIKA